LAADDRRPPTRPNSAIHSGPANRATPLIDKVRNATARYIDINVALREGFVQATPCVSGPDAGAMGVHFVLPARISGGVLNAEQPEALIYEQDLNVDTPAGVETLFGRIHSAAERVCSETDPLARVAASKCARKAEAGTIEKLNLPLLTAYYRMKNGGRTGMFTANR
jgi:UrcA family protein